MAKSGAAEINSNTTMQEFMEYESISLDYICGLIFSICLSQLLPQVILRMNAQSPMADIQYARMIESCRSQKFPC